MSLSVKIRSLVNIGLFFVMAISIVIPRAKSLSFCLPMDAVMLSSCCQDQYNAHGEQVDSQDTDSQIDIHNPKCCEDIQIPVTEENQASPFTFVALYNLHFISELPHNMLFGETEISLFAPLLTTMKARGPPRRAPDFFIQHCSYLI